MHTNLESMYQYRHIQTKTNVILMTEFFDLHVANSPSKLKFEANLSREDSQSAKHSQKPERISEREDSLIRKAWLNK